MVIDRAGKHFHAGRRTPGSAAAWPGGGCLHRRRGSGGVDACARTPATPPARARNGMVSHRLPARIRGRWRPPVRRGAGPQRRRGRFPARLPPGNADGRPQPPARRVGGPVEPSLARARGTLDSLPAAGPHRLRAARLGAEVESGWPGIFARGRCNPFTNAPDAFAGSPRPPIESGRTRPAENAPSWATPSVESYTARFRRGNAARRFCANCPPRSGAIPARASSCTRR